MLRTIAVVAIFALIGSVCHAAPVSQATARQVALNTISHHLALFGSWGGYDQPRILECRQVEYGGVLVGFNFSVFPAGHVLVAADDDLEPVLLYSATSQFDLSRADDPRTLESVMLNEFSNVFKSTKKFLSLRARQGRCLAPDERIERKNRAWNYFLTGPARNVGFVTSWKTRRVKASSLVTGLPLSTVWEQGYPYNILMPENNCLAEGLKSDNTLAGCVAVAWGQILYYWKWPVRGSGSHSYSWNGTTLSADFDHVYNWAAMQDQLGNSSSIEAKEAISGLLYDLGVAAEMNYGCDGSASSSFANDVLDLYFKYKSSMHLIDRSGYSAVDWFEVLSNEFDAEPERPVALSIFLRDDPDVGHEVVADGYQAGASRLIHINFGWGGYRDGYYAITSDFYTGSTAWAADKQYAVIGIEPDNKPPEVEAGPSYEVEVGDEVVLEGSVSDPEGLGIDHYFWTQLTGPGVTLQDEGGARRSFIAPQVSSRKELRFRLKAVDANRAVAVDYCTVSIEPKSTSEPSSVPAASGGSGGCFIDSVYDWN